MGVLCEAGFYSFIIDQARNHMADATSRKTTNSTSHVAQLLLCSRKDMAFIPSAPHKISTASAWQITALSRSRCRAVQPRHVSRQASLRMATGGNDPEEVSVPLSSLNNLNTPPATAPLANPATEDEDDNRTEQQKEADRLRAAESFITLDEGVFECTACSYMYEPKKGVKEAGIAADTPFEDLSPAFVCPVCRSPKGRFVSKKKVIAGFADNQSYGFGSNTMTGGQKSALIFGGLGVCFLLLLSGYALN